MCETPFTFGDDEVVNEAVYIDELNLGTMWDDLLPLGPIGRVNGCANQLKVDGIFVVLASVIVRVVGDDVKPVPMMSETILQTRMARSEHSEVRCGLFLHPRRAARLSGC